MEAFIFLALMLLVFVCTGIAWEIQQFRKAFWRINTARITRSGSEVTVHYE